MVEAESDSERELSEKAFARDVKGHIDAIGTKYVKPAEGTYDFAFMYLPVEGIYYELVCGKTGALLKYAHDRRVFPVSPTTFTAYLQSAWAQSMECEQNAQRSCTTSLTCTRTRPFRETSARRNAIGRADEYVDARSASSVWEAREGERARGIEAPTAELTERGSGRAA